MFLLLILFGLLALGLAFVTYWQADVQGARRFRAQVSSAEERRCGRGSTRAKRRRPSRRGGIRS